MPCYQLSALALMHRHRRDRLTLAIFFLCLCRFVATPRLLQVAVAEKPLPHYACACPTRHGPWKLAVHCCPPLRPELCVILLRILIYRTNPAALTVRLQAARHLSPSSSAPNWTGCWLVLTCTEGARTAQSSCSSVSSTQIYHG
jgi:hypothetical protein